MNEWIPIGALLVFILGWIKLVNDRVHSKTSKTYADETFQRSDLCDEKHKNVNEKLDRIDGKLDQLINNSK